MDYFFYDNAYSFFFLGKFFSTLRSNICLYTILFLKKIAAPLIHTYFLNYKVFGLYTKPYKTALAWYPKLKVLSSAS